MDASLPPEIQRLKMAMKQRVFFQNAVTKLARSVDAAGKILDHVLPDEQVKAQKFEPNAGNPLRGNEAEKLCDLLRLSFQDYQAAMDCDDAFTIVPYCQK